MNRYPVAQKLARERGTVPCEGVVGVTFTSEGKVEQKIDRWIDTMLALNLPADICSNPHQWSLGNDQKNEILQTSRNEFPSHGGRRTAAPSCHILKKSDPDHTSP